jgi:hypothetical protein
LQPRLAQKYANDKTGYQNHVCQKKCLLKMSAGRWSFAKKRLKVLI